MNTSERSALNGSRWRAVNALRVFDGDRPIAIFANAEAATEAVAAVNAARDREVEQWQFMGKVEGA